MDLSVMVAAEDAPAVLRAARDLGVNVVRLRHLSGLGAWTAEFVGLPMTEVDNIGRFVNALRRHGIGPRPERWGIKSEHILADVVRQVTQEGGQ